MSELIDDFTNDFNEKEPNIQIKSLIPKFKQSFRQIKPNQQIPSSSDLNLFDLCNQEENSQLDQMISKINSQNQLCKTKQLPSTSKSTYELDNKDSNTSYMNRKKFQKPGKNYDKCKVQGFSQAQIKDDDKFVFYRNNFSYEIMKVSPPCNGDLQNSQYLDQSRDQSRNSSNGKVSIHEMQKNCDSYRESQKQLMKSKSYRSQNIINSNAKVLYSVDQEDIKQKYIKWNPQGLNIVKPLDREQSKHSKSGSRSNRGQDSNHQQKTHTVQNKIVLRKENFSIEQLPLSYQSLLSKNSIHSILKNSSSGQLSIKRQGSNQSLNKKKVCFGLTQDQIENIQHVSKC